jgi:hypothetical protein
VVLESVRSKSMELVFSQLIRKALCCFKSWKKIEWARWPLWKRGRRTESLWEQIHLCEKSRNPSMKAPCHWPKYLLLYLTSQWCLIEDLSFQQVNFWGTHSIHNTDVLWVFLHTKTFASELFSLGTTLYSYLL